MITCVHTKLIFQHLVELPHCECVLCSTQEEGTGRARIFLVFQDKHKIYSRNGTKGNWEEVIDAEEHACIWEGFENAILERKVPSFVASGTSVALA